MDEKSEPVVPTDFDIRLLALLEAVKHADNSDSHYDYIVETANNFYRFLKGE